MSENRVRIRPEYVEEINKRFPHATLGNIINFWVACILYPKLSSDLHNGAISGVEVPRVSIEQIEKDFEDVFESW